MAARKRKVVLTDSWKDGIRVTMLMKRLMDHANGAIELSSTQVRAIEIVLSKLVPNLQSTQLEANISHYTNDLAAIQGIGQPVIAEQQADTPEITH